MADDLAWLVKPLEWKEEWKEWNNGGRIKILVAYCPIFQCRYYARIDHPEDIKKWESKHRVRVLTLLNTGLVTKMAEALRPFADCVFNDNGDCVVTDTYKVSGDAYIRAYFARRVMK